MYLTRLIKKNQIYMILIILILSPSRLFSQEHVQRDLVGLDRFFSNLNEFWGGIIFWDDHFLRLPFILVVLVCGGLFFTFRFRFVNAMLFKHAIDVVRGKYDNQNHAGEISHFQALTSALSATVGIGNIAGVAIAISLGGPGAVFWLWVVAFFGMSMKFSSCTLSQNYRIVNKDKSILGGPMVFLDLGIKELYPNIQVLGKIFGVTFAVFTIGASIGGGNLFQGNQTFELLVAEFPQIAGYDWLVGGGLAFFIGIVILGGIKRIGEVTSRLIPLVCMAYCFICLAVIFQHIEDLPHVFSEIFRQAFNPDAMWAGGFMGVMTQGVKRASFSNEAGIGSAAIAHAAAKTDKPIREGVVAMLGPFIDTHLVCTMTALAIILTGSHLDPTLSGKGAAITAKAFSSLGTEMPILLTFIAIVFAYSTAISWSYYGEKGVEYLFGSKWIMMYRSFYVVAAALGPMLSLKTVIDFADLMMLSMSFPNIIGMALLSSKVKNLLNQYKEDLKTGRI